MSAFVERVPESIHSPAYDVGAELFDMIANGRVEKYPVGIDSIQNWILNNVNNESSVLERTLSDAHGHLLSVLIPIIDRAKRVARIRGQSGNKAISVGGGGGDLLSIAGIGSGELDIHLTGTYRRHSALCTNTRTVLSSPGVFLLVSENLRRVRTYTATTRLWQTLPNIPEYTFLNSQKIHVEYKDGGKPTAGTFFVHQDPFDGTEPSLNNVVRSF
ncbi:MAG: hypothetical protein Q7S79_02810 [bacterium]|nr:hypothetical protein [bacterium]